MSDSENIIDGSVSADEIQQEKKASKKIWRMVSLSFYGLGSSFVIVFLTSQLKEYMQFGLGLVESDAQTTFVITAALGTTAYIISAVIGGSFSDGLRTRFGNRLPVVMIGATLASSMYIIAPFLITSENAFFLIPSIYIFIYFGLGIAVSPLYALISELFNREERAWVGLVNAGMDTIGTTFGLVLLGDVITDYTTIWIVAGCTLFFFSLLTFIFIPKTNPSSPRDGSTVENLKSTPRYLLKISGGDMWKMFIVQMIWGIATFTISLNLLNFLKASSTSSNPGLGLSSQGASFTLLLIGVAGALSGIPIGILIQLIGKVKSAIIGTGIFAMFSVLLSSQTVWNSDFVILVFIVGGIGTTIITTVTVALPSDLVPKGKEGQFMGIYLLANGAPKPIFLVLGVNWNYSQLFLVNGILLVVAIVALFGIQYEKMIDSEYKRIYERYLMIKGFVLDRIDIATEKLEEQIDFERIR